MCFFDQQLYACGDWKWASFRQHCAKEYRTGETCGMKLLMNTEEIDNLCKICEKIRIKMNKIQKEEDNVRRWRRDGNRKASIEKSLDIIADQQYSVAKLQRERVEKRSRLN